MTYLQPCFCVNFLKKFFQGHCNLNREFLQSFVHKLNVSSLEKNRGGYFYDTVPVKIGLANRFRSDGKIEMFTIFSTRLSSKSGQEIRNHTVPKIV